MAQAQAPPAGSAPNGGQSFIPLPPGEALWEPFYPQCPSLSTVNYAVSWAVLTAPSFQLACAAQVTNTSTSWPLQCPAECRYEPLRDLGSGNFGVAKLMRDKVTNDVLAVKFIERGERVGLAFI